jgi:hypothetical protein
MHLWQTAEFFSIKVVHVVTIGLYGDIRLKWIFKEWDGMRGLVDLAQDGGK